MLKSVPDPGVVVPSVVNDSLVKLMNEASPRVVATVSSGNSRESVFELTVAITPSIGVTGTLQSRSEYENVVKTDEFPSITNVNSLDWESPPP